MLHFRLVFLWERSLSTRNRPTAQNRSATLHSEAPSSGLCKGEGRFWGGRARSGGGCYYLPWQWDVSAWCAGAASLSLSFCPLMWQYSIQEKKKTIPVHKHKYKHKYKCKHKYKYKYKYKYKHKYKYKYKYTCKCKYKYIYKHKHKYKALLCGVTGLRQRCFHSTTCW